MAQSSTAPRVEVNVRWMLVLLSVVPFLVLRSHRAALVGYCIALSVLLVALLIWLPRRLADAERRFTREALRRLAMRDFAGVETLAAQQRLLSTFGRRHLIPETLGLAASASGQHEVARQRYAEALAVAAPDERLRLEVNLAGEELATGRLGEAEGRYRTVLRRRPDLPLALANLGRILVRREAAPGEDAESFVEAVDLLRRALPLSDARDVPGLRLALVEALQRSRAPRAEWLDELERARAVGADPAACDALAGDRRA